MVAGCPAPAAGVPIPRRKACRYQFSLAGGSNSERGLPQRSTARSGHTSADTAKRNRVFQQSAGSKCKTARCSTECGAGRININGSPARSGKCFARALRLCDWEVTLKTHNRLLGFNEARVGLTLLIAASVVFGYVALRRLGGSGDTPPIEIRQTPGDTVSPVVSAKSNGPELRVLRPQVTEQQEVPHLSQRPNWAAPAGPDIQFEIEANATSGRFPEAGNSIGDSSTSRLPGGVPK